MSYQCPYCPLRFGLRNERDYHVREDHPRRPAPQPADDLDTTARASTATAVPVATREPRDHQATPAPPDAAPSGRPPWWRRWRSAQRQPRA